jgi:hypothetical protein
MGVKIYIVTPCLYSLSSYQLFYKVELKMKSYSSKTFLPTYETTRCHEVETHGRSHLLLICMRIPCLCPLIEHTDN